MKNKEQYRLILQIHLLYTWIQSSYNLQVKVFMAVCSPSCPSGAFLFSLFSLGLYLCYTYSKYWVHIKWHWDNKMSWLLVRRESHILWEQTNEKSKQTKKTTENEKEPVTLRSPFSGNLPASCASICCSTFESFPDQLELTKNQIVLKLLL